MTENSQHLKTANRQLGLLSLTCFCTLKELLSKTDASHYVY